MTEDSSAHETEILRDRGRGYYVKCWTCGWQTDRYFTPSRAEAQADAHRHAMSAGEPGPPGL